MDVCCPSMLGINQVWSWSLHHEKKCKKNEVKASTEPFHNVGYTYLEQFCQLPDLWPQTPLQRSSYELYPDTSPGLTGAVNRIPRSLRELGSFPPAACPTKPHVESPCTMAPPNLAAWTVWRSTERWIWTWNPKLRQKGRIYSKTKAKCHSNGIWHIW